MQIWEIRSLRPKVGEVPCHQDGLRLSSVVFDVIDIVEGGGLDPTSIGGSMVDVVATGVYWITVATRFFACKFGVLPVLVEGQDLVHFHHDHRPEAVWSLGLAYDEVAGFCSFAYVRFARGECANPVKGVGREASIFLDGIYKNAGLVWSGGIRNSSR